MSANWFDHAIATVAPRAAARRVLARQAFETLTRGYDGAAKGRRTEGWRAPGTSADTEVGVAGLYEVSDLFGSCVFGDGYETDVFGFATDAAGGFTDAF